MQRACPTSSLEPPAAAPVSIKVTARSCRGDGTRLFAVEVAAADGTIADVKRLLCSTPHCMCSDAAALVLVLKGKGAAIPRATPFSIFHFNIKHLQIGSILHDDTALTSAALTEDSVLTAVILARGCPCLPPQQRPSAAAQPSPDVCVASTVSAPTFIDGESANFVEIPSVCSEGSDDGGDCLVEEFSGAFAVVKPKQMTSLQLTQMIREHCASDSSPSLSSPVDVKSLHAVTSPQPLSPSNSSFSDAATIQQGSHVRIQGLQAKPHLNARAGVVRGDFNWESGRWTVEVDADGTSPAFLGLFRPANLLPQVPSANPAQTPAQTPAATASAGPALKMPLPITVSQDGKSTTLHSTRDGKDFSIEMPTRLFRQIEPYMASVCARNPSIKDEASRFYGLQHASEAREALKQGAGVRIEDHRANPELNGLKGVVCEHVNDGSGTVKVRTDADATKPSLNVTIPRQSLKVIPKHNLSTEWLDEHGVVCPKNVDFGRQCPKGHALAASGCGCSSEQLLCRICHCYSRVCDEACRWLVCSLVEGCCGGYAVCDKCSAASPAAHTASNQWHTFCFSVCILKEFASHTVFFTRNLIIAAGCQFALPVLAALHNSTVSEAHHYISVLPNVHQASHVTQLQQSCKRASGCLRLRETRRSRDMVREPHLGQLHRGHP